MHLSLPTLLLLRQAALALVAAIECAALEGYGWAPRRKGRDIDECAIIQT
jgi:hypothetical protein